MKINKLILSGYKRLMLNNIKHLVYTPESIYQLILGTNGSGKSSILYELSPLPGNPSEYITNGYKEIHLEHNGSDYILKSIFKSIGKHEFIKNGENINPGGTVTIQKELVEREFKLTQEIHELLIGLTNYTNLSPAKRREWITRLCDVDFTYAIGVHQRLKSAARDAQGALKHTKSRLTEESNKLLGIGDIDQIETQYESLVNEINALFLERDNDSGEYELLHREFISLIDEVKISSKKLVLTVPTNIGKFTSLEDIQEEIIRINSTRQVKEEIKKRITTEYQELTELLDTFTSCGVQDVEDMGKQLETLKLERSNTISNLEKWVTIPTEAKEIENSLYSAMPRLAELLKTLPANIDRKYNRDKVARGKELLPNIILERDRARNKVSFYENKLEEINNKTEQNCPSCNFKWVPGKSEREIAEIIGIIELNNKKFLEYSKKESSIRSYLEEAEEYANLFGGLKILVNEYPRLKLLWDFLLDSPLLMNEPSALISDVNQFLRDVNKWSIIKTLDDKIERLEKLLEISHVGQSQKVTDRLVNLEAELENVTKEIIRIIDKHKELIKYESLVKAYITSVNTLETNIKRLLSLKDELLKSIRNREINKAINIQQESLAVVRSKKTEKNAIENIIVDLSTSEAKLAKHHECLSMLASELSPVDGLIAEQLLGFIESFVLHINTVIESIWSYELKILPCGLDGGDLDYKFPLYVKHEGKENITPDISRGSEAQVEVINLAFRLVTLVYLGLEESPVYLDECGKSFDEQHRLNLMNFIKRLVDTGNYTQLFMVSHYAAFHGSFTQAEVMVLDSTNITVPKVHNKHVRLE